MVIAYSCYLTQNLQKSQNCLSCSCILRFRWNPRNCRLGLKPCDWLRGVSANVLRSHCASRHDEVYDKFCGFKFFGVHFLLIRIRVNFCVFCEFCVRIFPIQFTIRLIPSIRLSVLKLISNPTFLSISLKYVRSCL